MPFFFSFFAIANCHPPSVASLINDVDVEIHTRLILTDYLDDFSFLFHFISILVSIYVFIVICGLFFSIVACLTICLDFPCGLLPPGGDLHALASFLVGMG